MLQILKKRLIFLAATNEELSYLFEWEIDDEWCEPDGNIDHYISKTYPLSEWFEAKHLSTDLAEPQIIIEDHYSE